MLNFRSLIWVFLKWNSKIWITVHEFFYIRISNFYFFVAERQTPVKPWPKTDKICSIDTLNSFTMVPDLVPPAAAAVVAAAEVATAQVNFIWYLLYNLFSKVHTKYQGSDSWQRFLSKYVKVLTQFWILILNLNYNFEFFTFFLLEIGLNVRNLLIGMDFKFWIIYGNAICSYRTRV